MKFLVSLLFLLIILSNAKKDCTTGPCTCNKGFEWNDTYGKCVIICTSSDPNSQAKPDPSNTDRCLCKTNYYYHVGKSLCIRDCRKAENVIN